MVYVSSGVRLLNSDLQCVSDFFFFFQAEDGIRDDLVTGVQTCALPISDIFPACNSRRDQKQQWRSRRELQAGKISVLLELAAAMVPQNARPVIEALQWRSEERRVGKEGRSRWAPYH